MKKKSILIKSAKLVSSKEIIKRDVFIENGKIKLISKDISLKANKVINAEKLHLLPGIIDTHVHFREPGKTIKEDFKTGGMAAVKGGVTTIFDMPNTNPSTIDKKTLNQKKRLANSKCLANYNFFIGVTTENIKSLNDYKSIPGLKLFLGSSEGNLLVTSKTDLEKLFKTTNHLIAVHAEDEKIIQSNKRKFKSKLSIFDHEKIRNVKAAFEATKKIVDLALKYNKKVHILHVTSADEINYIKKYKRSNLITVEVCPQHLLLNSPHVNKEFGNFSKVNPPIRSKKHRNALWKALKDGIIDTIATDHAPHLIKEKLKDFEFAPSGMPGIETSLSLMLNEVNKKKCSIKDIVKWMSENPSLIFNIKNKGFIKVGYDADLVLVDLNKKVKIDNKKVMTKAKWSIFNNKTLKGTPILTIINGNIVYKNNKINDSIKGMLVEFI